jgi:hypothetical protein
LGAVWEPQGPALRLSGNLTQFEARPLLVSAVVSRFSPVRLVFAWTQTDHIPVMKCPRIVYTDLDTSLCKISG